MKIIPIVFLLIIVSSCSPKIVPGPSTDTNVVVRDSIVYVKDTVQVPLPVEIIQTIVPAVEVWEAETSLAEARCELDTNLMVLRGEIKNKKTTLPAEIEHQEQYHQRDSIQIIKEPYPVEVEKKVYPKWLIIIAILGAVCLTAEFMRIFIK